MWTGLVSGRARGRGRLPYAAGAPPDLNLPAPETPVTPQTLQEAQAVIEADLICQALARNHGNITHTATELGLSHPTLRELVRKYDLCG